MIAFIKGIIQYIEKDSVIIDNHGIGYQVFMSDPLKISRSEEVMIYTYQQVREDDISLFGFLSIEEHDLFIKLISVKGVGSKTALNMLRACPFKDMLLAIEQKDVSRLKSLPGIGLKTASQIVLDLKGKLIATTEELVRIEVNENMQDALDALLKLGYKQSELNSIKKELSEQEVMSSDAYLRRALTLLAKGKGV